MRAEASVLHLDLDAFFASVEQRDKPSLRGKPVVVGGIGQRGVVATASYEARVFGVRSAMPAQEARRRCPHAAFLAARFDAYREASGQVMAILRDVAPLVEPLSLDEAFVDLRTATAPVDYSPAGLRAMVAELKRRVFDATGGLTASVGVATSKFMAKVASELAKPDGVVLVEPGTEVELLGPMSVRVIPGVGPVSVDKLRRIGLTHVADLQGAVPDELSQVVGKLHAQSLLELAMGRDDRPVVGEREAKSISVEDTFETDLVNQARLSAVAERHAKAVAARLTSAGLFARTVTLKVRLHDFTTLTRSRSLTAATDRAERIGTIARSLLAGIDTTAGVRLLGVGVAGLTELVQEDLFAGNGEEPPSADADDAGEPAAPAGVPGEPTAWAGLPRHRGWSPGADVVHDQLGQGWVWGSGLGRVTVRFETRHTAPGPIHTFRLDDPALRLV